MLSRIHNKLGTAGLIVAVVALIASLGGAAFAASGKLTSTEKKEVKKIAKQVATPGPAGAIGPAGPQGPKGDSGTKGDQGPKGDTGDTGLTGEAGMCSDGEPDCSLASGAMLTGIYSAAAGEGETVLANISFPVRVSPAPIALYPTVGFFGRDIAFELKNPGEGQGGGQSSTSLYKLDDPFSETKEIAAAKAYEEACGGSFGSPKAAPGILCLYPGTEKGSLVGPSFESKNTEAAHDFGITVPLKYDSAAGGETGTVAIQIGSWAVGG
jgi:hypothetical protein